MGTRSIVHFYDEKEHVLSVYQQYDGYPNGVGLELAEFLSKGEVVTGFAIGDKINFNGMPCLAAQFIVAFKKGIGGLYITNKKDQQEYNYTVKRKNGKLELTIKEENLTVFKGDLKKFKTFCETSEA